jgi:hypothetical protein
MTIQKSELFKAVKAIAWPGDVKLLWKGLDKDNSGITSLQELDMRTAERLAKFKGFTETKFGSAVEAFRAFDIQNKGKLKEQEFLEACEREGFSKVSKSLFYGLDWQKNKYVWTKTWHFWILGDVLHISHANPISRRQRTLNQRFSESTKVI